MSHKDTAPETQGVTVELLSIVDLGPEIAGMDGRLLRMRIDRPGTVFIIEGTITDHRNGIATDYGPGVGWPEAHNTVHWLENRGPVTAVEISVDIVKTA